jgi:hypothetical protein
MSKNWRGPARTEQNAGIASGAPGSVGVATLLTHEYPPRPTPSL